MNKTERLLTLTTLLSSRRTRITAAELADRLNVSVRTVYRDIQSLILSGVPIEGEAGVGYLMGKGATLPPLMFTLDELETLILGARMVKAFGGETQERAAESALEKVHAVLPDKYQYHQEWESPWWIVPPSISPVQKSPHSDALRTAIKGFQKVEIGYTTPDANKTTRVIWPLGLVFLGNVWMLVSWCELRGEYRCFRLDRINHLTPTTDIFTVTPTINLQTYLDTVC
jgi:predicted DNA-binding transcriptional regulator YafY